MSRSLHSSTEYFGGSNRCSRNDSDMVPWKSSIGLISSKISSRPDLPGTSSRPLGAACSTRACHFSLPSSQSKLSVCRARRFGTSRGSRIFAKVMRRGAVLLVMPVVLRWACWRCAGRPRGVLPRAAGPLRARMPDRPGQIALGQVRWQRKATAYPLGTPTSSGPPSALAGTGPSVQLSRREQDGPQRRRSQGPGGLRGRRPCSPATRRRPGPGAAGPG